MNRLKQWAIFLLGLFLLSLGVVFTIQARLGVSAWDVFHTGLAKKIQWLTIGKASQLTTLLLFAISFTISKVTPKIGTIINIWSVGFLIDLLIPIIPIVNNLIFQWAYLLSGILFIGMGISFYISASCGLGARDSLMIALNKKIDLGLKWIRIIIDMLVLIIGYILGGTVGVGTICIALGVGPIIEIFLNKINQTIAFPS